MSNIYKQLCEVIQTCNLFKIKTFTNSIINKNNASDISAVYDNYNADKEQFKALYLREKILSVHPNSSESYIEELQTVIDWFIASICVKHQALPKSDQRLKRGQEPHPDEPKTKKTKHLALNDIIDLDLDTDSSISSDEFGNTLSQLDFSANQIDVITAKSTDLKSDFDCIFELRKQYQIPTSTICHHIENNIPPAELLSAVKNLSDLRLSTKKEEDKFTSAQIKNMLKTSKSFANSQYLLKSWSNIKVSQFTSSEMTSIVCQYETTQLEKIFFFLSELREKKCPYPGVTSISMRRPKKILKLLYQNFDKFAEHGWDNISERSYQELKSLSNKLTSKQAKKHSLNINSQNETTSMQNPNLEFNSPFNPIKISSPIYGTKGPVINTHPLQSLQQQPPMNPSSYTGSLNHHPNFYQQNSNQMPYNHGVDMNYYNYYSTVPEAFISHVNHSNPHMNHYNLSNVSSQFPHSITQSRFNNVNIYPITNNIVNTNVIITHPPFPIMSQYGPAESLPQQKIKPSAPDFTHPPAKALINWGVFNLNEVHSERPIELKLELDTTSISIFK